METKTPSKNQLLDVTKNITQFEWKKHGLTVVRDGYLENGIRVHAVKEVLANEPILIDNAYVVSIN